MIPLTRSSALVEGGKVRCWSHGSPHFFKKSDGTLNLIDLSPRLSVGKTGDIKLHDRGVLSVGVRNDGKVDKFFGIRPDETQDLGTEQIEFTPTGVELSREEVSFKASDLDVFVGRASVRHVVKVGGEISDFRVSYLVHVKGFDLVDQGTVSDKQVRRAIDIEVRDIGSVKGLEFADAIKVAVQKPTIFIGFVTDNHIFVSGERRAEEWSNLPLDYTTSQTEFPGASMFARNNVMVVAKGFDGYKPSVIETMIVNVFRHGLNLEQHSDHYLCQKGKGKSVGWAWASDGMFWLMMNTTDISDVAQYFTSKDFDDVGFVPAKYSDVLSMVSLEVSKRNGPALVVPGNSAAGDVFLFRSKFSNQTLKITRPAVLDSTGKVLFDQNEHSLKDNGDGTFTYVKYASEEQILLGLHGVAYVDTSCYSSNADGKCFSISPTSSGWALIHDAAQSQYVDTSTQEDSSQSIQASLLGIKVSNFYIHRGFFYFDTTAITGTVSAATLYLYASSTSSGDKTLSAQKGTQADTLTVNDYTAFSGSTYGQNASWTNNTYNSIPFNATGISDIVKGGTTKVCVRQHTNDYLDSAPSVTNYVNIWWADSTGTDKDPYLDVTASSQRTTSPMPMFFRS